MANFRVRLLKEHAGNPIGAVLRLPREEALRLDRLSVGVCLDKAKDQAEELPLPVPRNQYAVMNEQAKTVLPEPKADPEPAPPVGRGRGKGKPKA